MTRQEHLDWCKRRALDYLNVGDIKNAVASMLSDLDKHEETRLQKGSPLVALGLMYATSGSFDDVRRFIVGFN